MSWVYSPYRFVNGSCDLYNRAGDDLFRIKMLQGGENLNLNVNVYVNF